MATTRLTPEQRRLIEQAGDRPVRIEDPESQQAYMLIRADLYERVRDVLEPEPGREVRIAEGIRHSQAAFWRDLPQLLAQRKLRGRWVCYHGDEQVGIGTHEELIRDCGRRGLAADAFYIGRILPRDLPPWEPEEIEPLGPHHLEHLPAES